jgi:hypothetical protein
MYELIRSLHFRIWLAIMGTATLIIGSSYAMVQQSTRLAADDLPLATATLVKDQLEAGANPADVVTPKPISLRNNTNVFVIVSDSSRHVLRLATRVVKYGNNPNNGYVIAGQSLAQAEDRIAIYTELALAAWLATLAFTYLTLLMPERFSSKKR